MLPVYYVHPTDIGAAETIHKSGIGVEHVTTDPLIFSKLHEMLPTAKYIKLPSIFYQKISKITK